MLSMIFLLGLKKNWKFYFIMLYCVKNHAVAYESSGLKIFHAKLRSIFFTWISIRLLLFSCATYRICYRYKLSSAIVKAVLHPFHVPSYIAKSAQKLINKGIVNDRIRWQTFRYTVKPLYYAWPPWGQKKVDAVERWPL